jgi:DASS family divalent anion:Na+ symporter
MAHSRERSQSIFHKGETPMGFTAAAARPGRRTALLWAVVLLPPVAMLLAPRPSGVTAESWRLLAIFAAVVAGLIVQPVPGGLIVLLGVAAIAITGVMPVKQALAGYADPTVWLVLAACFIARGMIKTGLGRRIAFLFIRAIGHRTLGLGYALVATDMLLAAVIPSNGARAGGIIFPIAKSLAEAYDSRPGASAGKLGAFLMVLVYQCEVVICAMFLTGQASNVLIAKFAKDVTGLEITYAQWLAGAVAPGLASLVAVPLLLYWVFPPEIKRTPAAAQFAAEELTRLGPMSRGEKLMLGVFSLIAGLWTLPALPGVKGALESAGLGSLLNYAVVALIGISVLLLSGVLEWDDVLSERGAWDIFIWYGGLVRMAEALGETGLTKRFADAVAGLTGGWSWWAALIGLLIVYFYAHYGFASITAHATAMYAPFLAVIVAAGAPPLLAALLLAYFSNLDASLTHYGTTPAPIYFGAGYVSQPTWWRLGLLASIPNILLWIVIGAAWCRLLGYWR